MQSKSDLCKGGDGNKSKERSVGDTIALLSVKLGNVPKERQLLSPAEPLTALGGQPIKGPSALVQFFGVPSGQQVEEDQP